MSSLNTISNQVVYPTCRFHGNRINTTCTVCLAVSGLSPTSTTTDASDDTPISPLKSVEITNTDNMYPITDPDERHMYRMRFALQEMDNRFNFVPSGYFLDLGCCPGGFSTYVLGKWLDSRGIGVSLLPKPGVIHSLAVPPILRDRLEVHWTDVTMFDLAPSLTCGLPEQLRVKLHPIPWPVHSFAFVIADGHQHPRMLDKNRESWSKDRLLLSQLLVALRAVKPSGTLLAKFSLRASFQLTERIVLALNQISLSPLRAVKPKSIYASEATFYLLVQYFDLDGCTRLAQILECLWYVMTFGGPRGFGRGLTGNELSLITPYPDVVAARPKLGAFFAPIEALQMAAKLQEMPQRTRI